MQSNVSFMSWTIQWSQGNHDSHNFEVMMHSTIIISRLEKWKKIFRNDFICTYLKKQKYQDWISYNDWEHSYLKNIYT